jgi:integrase
VNPTAGLELPAVRGGRERIADPEEAARLLAALPVEDRAVWATAVFAGLRRGELRALTVDSIDLTANIIRVDFGWDDKVGRITTKGRNRRRVPIPKVLRKILLEHLARTGRRDGLVFDFYPRRLTERADKAWAAAGLDRVTLHECRHTYASLMIAAGVNAKALSTYMGHSNISITLDRYGHLMPGNEEEAAGLLDSYLTHATGVK